MATKRPSSRGKTKVESSAAIPESVATSSDHEAPKKSTPYLSHYEYSDLILARTLQLMAGQAPLISLDEIDDPNPYDPLVIATHEVRRYLPKLVVRRKLDDGTVEDWFLTDRELHLPRC